MPAVGTEIDGWPHHLAPCWQDDFATFHSPEWWANVWAQVDTVRVDRADLVLGPQDCLTWAEAWDDWARANGWQPYEPEAQMLCADRDELLGFTRLFATNA